MRLVILFMEGPKGEKRKPDVNVTWNIFFLEKEESIKENKNKGKVYTLRVKRVNEKFQE